MSLLRFVSSPLIYIIAAMETIIGHEALEPRSSTVATIGTFDGIHLGHQAIIRATVEAAQKAGLPSLLLTFDVHPRTILRRNEPVEALTSLDDKLELLDQFGLDYVCTLKFKQIAGLSPREFYEQILVERARAVQLFVGTNFRFGAGAAGDPAWLRQAGQGLMEITEFALQSTNNGTISSTSIRDLLRSGRVSDIPAVLGRNISLSGQVVRGAGRGVGLGFPTANIEFTPDLCTPAMGVYISYLHVGSQRLPAVTSCGTKPTFGGEAFTCEAHVLDYERQLYGQAVKLELTKRIRSERKFPSPEALSRQIMDDVSQARAWFSAEDASR